ncbi:hypothetical protein PYW07_014612 [Mythimna separata]|uniref:Uncharacterized protein n=1 Tax=Mythimna separata TaxID=271217 RepID=A0AAD7YZU4_MYTSE|nr:hypothetical protein PYW07_014612 [Mythimna separata]
MSEYCRRRVMPSVFLGRQVVDAYSQILHFSQLELPYSCFVSIRTESGSNIILVVQLASEKSVIDACHASKNQLLVYGIGETFGGYWGALPDNVMRPRKSKTPPDEARYTLKTTQSTTTVTTTKRTTRLTTTPSTTRDSEEEWKKTTSQQDEMVVEVPLVNVSAVLVPGDLPRFALFDAEETFDSVIDVKPLPGVSYKTTVLPLVQFAMLEEGKKSLRVNEGDERGNEGGERGNEGDERGNEGGERVNEGDERSNEDDEPVAPRYEVEFSGDWFTPDARRSSVQKETQLVSNPYGIVDAILKNLSKIKDEGPKTTTEIDKDVANLLQGLANIGHHNESVVLVPNESWYTRRPASTSRLISTRYRTGSITWRQPSASYRCLLLPYY